MSRKREMVRTVKAQVESDICREAVQAVMKQSASDLSAVKTADLNDIHGRLLQFMGGLDYLVNQYPDVMLFSEDFERNINDSRDEIAEIQKDLREML